MSLLHDHYDTLGVKPDASTKDIKTAFRRAVKQAHPDVRGDGAQDGEPNARMRAILEAYRVLVSPVARKAYDRTRRKRSAASGFEYRSFLRARMNDPESVAKLVVYDLLHGREEEALEAYERLKTMGGARMERFFARSDAMDTELCVGEEYAKRGRIDKAYPIYRKLIRMEAKSPAFGYYFDVVLDDFRVLVCEKARKTLDPEAFLDLLEEASELGIAGRVGAEIHAKRAECLFASGDAAAAAEAFFAARSLSAGIPALRRVGRKMGIA